MKEIYREDYQMKILKYNSIAGLVPVFGSGFNENTVLSYDTDGKETIEEYFSKREIGSDELYHLFSSIEEVQGRIKEYLLEEERIEYNPKYIYISDGKYSFVYNPYKREESYKEGLSAFIQFLVKNLNNRDEAAEKVIFMLYKENIRGNHSLKKLIKDVLSVLSAYDEKDYVASRSENCKIEVDREENFGIKINTDKSKRKAYEVDKEEDFDTKFEKSDIFGSEDLGLENIRISKLEDVFYKNKIEDLEEARFYESPEDEIEPIDYDFGEIDDNRFEERIDVDEIVRKYEKKDKKGKLFAKRKKEKNKFKWGNWENVVI